VLGVGGILVCSASVFSSTGLFIPSFSCRLVTLCCVRLHAGDVLGILILA